VNSTEFIVLTVDAVTLILLIYSNGDCCGGQRKIDVVLPMMKLAI